MGSRKDGVILTLLRIGAVVVLTALLPACSGGMAEQAFHGDEATLAAFRPSSPVAQGDAEAEVAAPQSFYIEFRARAYGPFGHTYMIYGPLDANGNPLEAHYIGFAPKGGAVGYAVASSPAFVPGTLEPSERDFKMKPLTTYRHVLTPEQYANVLAFVANAHKQDRWWNLYLSNCNSFAGEMARAAGLSAPLVPTVVPLVFVTELRNLNEQI